MEEEIRKLKAGLLRGRWLAEQREASGRSRTELAAALGVTAQQWSNYEKGTGIPEDKPAGAATLARLFGLPVMEVRHQLGWWIPTDADVAEFNRYSKKQTKVTRSGESTKIESQAG